LFFGGEGIEAGEKVVGIGRLERFLPGDAGTGDEGGRTEDVGVETGLGGKCVRFFVGDAEAEADHVEVQLLESGAGL
jgi:hypothetical protein